MLGNDISITGKFDSVDEAAERFLDLTRRIDVLRLYVNTGKLPKRRSMDYYGGIDLESVFSGVVSKEAFGMRASISISKLHGENPIEYWKEVKAISAEEYGEEAMEAPAKRAGAKTSATAAEIKTELEQLFDIPFEEMTKEQDIIFNRTDPLTVKLRAEIKSDRLSKPSSYMQEQFNPERLDDLTNSEAAYLQEQQEIENKIIRQETIDKRTKKIVNKPTQAKPQSTLRAGKVVPQKTAQAQMRYAAAIKEGAKTSLEYDLIDYGDADDLIGSGSVDDLINYVDNPFHEGLATISQRNLPFLTLKQTKELFPHDVGGASRAGTAANIIKGVETATKLVTAKSPQRDIAVTRAVGASALGLAGGYMYKRKKTRR